MKLRLHFKLGGIKLPKTSIEAQHNLFGFLNLSPTLGMKTSAQAWVELNLPRLYTRHLPSLFLLK